MTRQAIPLHRGTYDPQFPPVDPRIVAARFSGPARHYRIGEPSLFAEIFAEPGSHLIVGLLGFATGCFGTVGVVYLISMVLE
jgi:hypothetical protein